MISKREALSALEVLVRLTTGWNEDAALSYAAKLAEFCSSSKALHAATVRISETWKRNDRPTIAVILDQYRTEKQRLDVLEGPPGLPSANRTIPFREGLKVARASYEAECERRGVEPNDQVFMGLTRAIGRQS